MTPLIKALFFDVFGTLADWRNGIAREAKRLLLQSHKSTDWITFADAWRAEYQPGMEAVRSGRIPFSKLDLLHRHNLARILPRFGMTDLPEPVLRELNLAWHRLDMWPDVRGGLARLRTKYLLAPVSNGNISLMGDLARHNALSGTPFSAPKLPAITSQNRTCIWRHVRHSTWRPPNA